MLMDAAPPDVYEDYAGFLQIVAAWIKERAKSTSKRTGLASMVVRNASEVWGGVGVYTVCELFFLASKFLLCPSHA
jgi:hypothetical protein